MEERAAAPVEQQRKAPASSGASSWDPGAKYRNQAPVETSASFTPPAVIGKKEPRQPFDGAGNGGGLQEMYWAIRIGVTLISLAIILFRSCAA